MIKLIGMLMIMCAGCGSGFTFSSKVKRHVAVIEAIDRMFAETAVMINFNAVTFRELIVHLKSCPRLKELKFLDVDLSPVDIRESILKSVKENADDLDDEENMQLYGFFMQFGCSDIDGQLLMAEKYHEFFRSRVKELREESIKKCRLYNSIGFLSGAFVAVILQ